MNSARRIRIVTVAAGVACLAATLPARAVSLFDFEDGTLQGWLAATTGGSGAAVVQAHNGSEMAFVQHTGRYTHSLSSDFTYAANEPLSFDMQAVAVPGSYGENAGAGVDVSFLNAFNVALGSFSLYNITNPGALGAHQFPVDNSQHHYDATMAAFAAQAGLDPSLAISKVSLRFAAYGEQYHSYSQPSYASVWFDNVQVGAVPEPDTQALLLAGLGMIAIAARRRLRPSASRLGSSDDNERPRCADLSS